MSKVDPAEAVRRLWEADKEIEAAVWLLPVGVAQDEARSARSRLANARHAAQELVDARGRT